MRSLLLPLLLFPPFSLIICLEFFEPKFFPSPPVYVSCTMNDKIKKFRSIDKLGKLTTIL